MMTLLRYLLNLVAYSIEDGNLNVYFDDLMTESEIEEDLDDYTFSAVANNEEGYVHLKIKGHFNGNLCIRRASSENQFTSWEDLKYITSANINNEINYVFNDITVKSGVFYRYGIQRITYNKQRGDLQEIGLDENSLLNILLLNRF